MTSYLYLIMFPVLVEVEMDFLDWNRKAFVYKREAAWEASEVTLTFNLQSNSRVKNAKISRIKSIFLNRSCGNVRLLCLKRSRPEAVEVNQTRASFIPNR